MEQIEVLLAVVYQSQRDNGHVTDGEGDEGWRGGSRGSKSMARRRRDIRGGGAM